uniref:tRNA(Ile)-lysidine synthase n=1 Tax=Prototheca wickerhamii TaxID=3111 RepID=A0A067Z0T7_PROWI|nr:tRNA-Ile lysidine synthase [Prototheca wickerhamii]
MSNNAFSLINKKIKSNKIFNNNLLIQRENYLCSISSGQDSTFLFFFLLHLKNKWNFNLHLLYCHHLWQQSNFFSYRQICKLAYIFKTPICINLSEKTLINEDSARNWRQESYNRSILVENCNKIFLGHTASDQLETAFFNLHRGTSPQGFCSLKDNKKKIIPFSISILAFSFLSFYYPKNDKKKVINKCYKNTKFFNTQWFKTKRKKANTCVVHFLFSSKIRRFYYLKLNKIFFVFFVSYKLEKNKIFSNLLVRPLLCLHRNDLSTLSKFYQIPIITDFSNMNLFISRNKMRHFIFRKLRAFLNSSFDLNFYRYVEISLEEQYYLNNIIIDLIKNTENLKINELPRALQRRYIYIIFEAYTEKKCTYAQIEFISSIL